MLTLRCILWSASTPTPYLPPPRPWPPPARWPWMRLGRVPKPTPENERNRGGIRHGFRNRTLESETEPDPEPEMVCFGSGLYFFWRVPDLPFPLPVWVPVLPGFLFHFWRALDLPLPRPVWVLVLPGFQFRVPLRIPGPGFSIGFGCPVAFRRRFRNPQNCWSVLLVAGYSCFA